MVAAFEPITFPPQPCCRGRLNKSQKHPPFFKHISFALYPPFLTFVLVYKLDGEYGEAAKIIYQLTDIERAFLPDKEAFIF